MKKFYFFDTALTFAITSLREQIEGTFFGILWFLLNPLFLFGLLYFVFSGDYNLDSYFHYLAIGVLLWSFMQQSLNESVYVNRDNSEFIKSINFPYNVFVFGIVLKNFVLNFGSFILIILISLFYSKFNFIFLIYPLMLLIFAILVYGLTLSFSSISTYNGDFISIWNILSVLWWFFTPIFYYLDEGSVHYLLNHFNPIFYFISFFRALVIDLEFNTFFFLFAIMYALISLLLGLFIYKKLKGRFSEVL